MGTRIIPTLSLDRRQAIAVHELCGILKPSLLYPTNPEDDATVKAVPKKIIPITGIFQGKSTRFGMV
jgi:hypothetical protein